VQQSSDRHAERTTSFETVAKRLKLAIIVVHYHTPELMHAALTAVRADTADLELDCTAIVVDNGSTPGDETAWTSLGAGVIRPGANLGYAGAVNHGVARSDADFLVLMNPDVIVRPGCIPRLLYLLRDGAAAAGPRFWWDHDRTMLLPPTERRTLVDEALRALAERSPAWAKRARQRWRAHTWRHWRATEPLASHDLSGGLLAVSRIAWERVGPFDDGYRLYFEETDWLHRVRRSGLRCVYEPRAEAVHLYARSTAGQPQAPTWFAQSEARFRRRRYGPWGQRLLNAVARRGRRVTGEKRTSGDRTGTERSARAGGGDPAAILLHDGDDRAAWIELAPGTVGFPAAGAPVDANASSWALPPPILSRLQPGPYTLRPVTERGRELPHVTFSVPGH